MRGKYTQLRRSFGNILYMEQHTREMDTATSDLEVTKSRLDFRIFYYIFMDLFRLKLNFIVV